LLIKTEEDVKCHPDLMQLLLPPALLQSLNYGYSLSAITAFGVRLP
jgi:hypothetical protein